MFSKLRHGMGLLTSLPPRPDMARCRSLGATVFTAQEGERSGVQCLRGPLWSPSVSLPVQGAVEEGIQSAATDH